MTGSAALVNTIGIVEVAVLAARAAGVVVAAMREGRMTVTIGRRELLAALGGAAIAWPLASINVIEGGCHG